MPRRILSVSHSKPLLDTRAMILQQHGYAVSSVDDLQEAIRLCRSQSFDAVVIGHSIPAPDRYHIAAVLRETSPGVFVLVLKTVLSNNVSFADAAVDAFSPDDLVAELDRVLGDGKGQ